MHWKSRRWQNKQSKTCVVKKKICKVNYMQSESNEPKNMSGDSQNFIRIIILLDIIFGVILMPC
jgi:hypothetical protein